MPNTFISVKEIARQALPRLIENLVFPNLIHRDYSDDFQLGKGAKIQVRRPVVLNATEFVEADGTTPEDISEQTVDVTLDKIATVDTQLGALERAVSVDDLNRIFVEPAAVALAQKINSDGLSLYADIPYYAGTAGTTPDGLDDFANAEKVLNLNKAPVTPRNAVWNPDADAAFKQIAAIVNAEKSGTTAALRSGSIGRIFGLENYMTQAIKDHAPGTAISSGATITAGAAATKGALTVKLKVATGTGTLVKGDLLTIGGKSYVVTGNADLSTTAADVGIYPALAAAVSSSDAVTYVGSATVTKYANNLAFCPQAFAFVTRPLIAPAGVESYTTAFNGISLRVVRGYDMKYKREMLSMDVLYGYKTMYPELATRILG